jgi:hypothetical protein
MLAKYDADGDGRITGLEYDRDGSSFASLDRDRNGHLDAQDFEAAREVGVGSSSRRAEMALMFYFQDDQDLDSLTMEELERADSWRTPATTHPSHDGLARAFVVVLGLEALEQHLLLAAPGLHAAEVGQDHHEHGDPDPAGTEAAR